MEGAVLRQKADGSTSFEGVGSCFFCFGWCILETPFTARCAPATVQTQAGFVRVVMHLAEVDVCVCVWVYADMGVCWCQCVVDDAPYPLLMCYHDLRCTQPFPTPSQQSCLPGLACPFHPYQVRPNTSLWQFLL